VLPALPADARFDTADGAAAATAALHAAIDADAAKLGPAAVASTAAPVTIRLPAQPTTAVTASGGTDGAVHTLQVKRRRAA
jgi:hypothetical protein